MSRKDPSPHMLDYAGKLDGESSRQRIKRTFARAIAGVIAFVIGAVGCVCLLMFLWNQFNTVGRDEMSQGIAGTFFTLLIALPLGICSGVLAALIAVGVIFRRK